MWDEGKSETDGAQENSEGSRDTDRREDEPREEEEEEEGVSWACV